MKAGWQIKPLGDVATVGAGNSAPQGDELFKDGKYPFFRTSDAGKIRFGDIYEASDNLNEQGIKGLRLFPKGTMLFPKSGASTFLNHRVMLGVDGYVSSHLATIVADTSQVHERFLLYFLTTISAQDLVQDHAYPSLNLPIISGIQLPCPSLPEQQRIVTILDQAFSGIAAATANAEKNLANARELFHSELRSVFSIKGEGWEARNLADVCEISSTLVDPRDNKYQNMLHVGGANIESKTGQLLDLKSAREESLISSKFVFDETMVLYSKIRPYLMKVAKPNSRGLCSADIYPLSVKADQLDRDFLFYLLLSPAFTEYANAGSARAGMPKVNRDHLFAFRCHIPSIAKQREYASKLDELSTETKRLEAIYQQKLAALEELKKSILHQAFTGQLN